MYNGKPGDAMIGDSNFLCKLRSIGQSRAVRLYVSEPYSNTEETKARYIFNSVCRDMQRRFHRASESLFVAPSALPMREVISASMEPSAEMIEPIYVNEDTIRLVLEINMALVLVRLIHIPTLIASLLRVGVQNTGIQN